MIFGCGTFTLYAGSLLLAPMLLGIIPRVKAWFAGRQGQPLFQVYYDLGRLFRKGAVYSTTTTWVFRFGPMVGLAGILTAMVCTPIFGFPALIAFDGDIILFAYILALMRFFMITTAMDTGSAFEGMGASREAAISMINEPALFLVLAILAKQTGQLSLTGMLCHETPGWWLPGPTLTLVSVTLFMVILVENYRVPIDDPTTHLELTMIHEVMVLDNSGPDFGFVIYTVALKLWLTLLILAQIVVPEFSPDFLAQFPSFLQGIMRPLVIFAVMIFFTIIIGIVESIIARLRLVRIPSLLIGVSSLALLGFILLK